MDLEKLFRRFAKKLKTTTENKGFEMTIELPVEIGKGQLKGFDFGEGFSMISCNADIYKIMHLDFDDNNQRILRYCFLIAGDLIHYLSPNFRYRLTSHTSSIVSLQQIDGLQKFIFPAQKCLNIIVLQFDAEKFVKGLRPEHMALPEDLAKVFLNDYDYNFFLYQSAYPLGIFDVQKEMNEVKAEGLLRRFFFESKALELIWMQTEQYRREQLTGFDKDILRKIDIKVIIEAKNQIREKLHENLTLRLLAKAVGTNETKLKSGFKKLYGKTFGEILREERLNQSRVLLKEGNLSIKEIALKCGYTSGSVFAKRFREKFGILPGSYAKHTLSSG